MAESVVKLRIDSKEYDANIKRAGEALTQYFNRVREGGGTLEHLDDGVLDAVKAMGELGTRSDSTRGALRELSQATADMTVQYRSLTDAERATPLGEAMAQSIAQMTERAGVMRDAMDDVTASIQHAASDTRLFDQLSQGASVLTAGFQGLTGAGKLLGINMGDNVEVIAKLQAAMAVTNSLTTIQTALQKQSALMQGLNAAKASISAAAHALLSGQLTAAAVAQKALNLAMKAAPWALAATAIYAVCDAIGVFSSKTEDASQKEADFAESIRLTNVQIDQNIRSLQTYYAIIQTLLSATGGTSIEQKALELAAAEAEYKSLVQEKKNSPYYNEELSQKVEQAGQKVVKLRVEMQVLSRAQDELINNWNKWDTEHKINATINALKKIREGYSITSKAYKEYTRRIDILQNKLSPKKLREGGRNVSSTNQGVEDPMSINSRKISDLTIEYINATNERRTAIEAEIAVLQKRNEEIQKLKDMALGKAFDAGSLPEITITGSKPRKEKPKEEKEVNLTKEIASMSGGISSMVGGLEQLGIDIPKGMNDVLGGIQAVTSILTGISTILTAIEAISTADTIIPFASGGVVKAAGGYRVPGRTFSGDLIPARLNAGELVLNQAQAGVIASVLQDRDFSGGMGGQPYVEGEKIFLGMNNTSKRMGKGEIVTTSMLRRMGLMN